MKKKYIIPTASQIDMALIANLMDLSAPGVGIGGGGEGSNDDDPDSKKRKNDGSSWQSLW